MVKNLNINNLTYVAINLQRALLYKDAPGWLDKDTRLTVIVNDLKRLHSLVEAYQA